VILADTSVWIDHLHRGGGAMERLLDLNAILIHPLVLGEIAMGSLHRRETLLRAIGKLSAAEVARHEEVMALVERERLYGVGIGYMDAHLLASTLLTQDARLWTRDRRLHEAARKLDVAIKPWGRD
jgi:predicted nucleic acid-binding protein